MATITRTAARAAVGGAFAFLVTALAACSPSGVLSLQPRGDVPQGIIVRTVQRVAVVVEFDGDVARTKKVYQTPGFLFRVLKAAVAERMADGSFAAPGQYHPVVACPGGELGKVVPGLAFLCFRFQLSFRDCRGQLMIALCAAGEDEQMPALRVWFTVLGFAQFQG